MAGGVEKEYFSYNFTGQPIKKLHTHIISGKTVQTEYYNYAYDHAGRLLKTTHQLTEGTTVKPLVVLAENTYDELGRLKTNKKGGNENLKLTFDYNVRSWTKSISNTLFSQSLYYNESYAGNTPQYGGNISAMTWKVQGETNTRGYTFAYDTQSRLTAANYLENGTANTNYKTAYSYDKHGNMLTTQRYGKTTASAYGLIDNLTMTYKGNQLLTANDAVATISLAESADFKNYSNVATEYTYNKNGAMTKDLNKGISDIQYNSLNLPRQMDIKSPVAEARNEYIYSAGGQKLKVTQKWNSSYSTSPVIGSAVNAASLNMTKTTDYVGNKVYENNVLKRIIVDGGYIEGGVYYFYLTDHLGNNRIVANQSGTIIQKNHYYPFGMTFAESTDQNKQPYKYNNKELDNMHGLNLYDYSARYMEPALGRFTTVDPLAEKYYSISPYAYCNNNPIKYIDPTGMSYTYNWNTGEYEYTDGGGNTKTVSQEEAIRNSGSKHYDLTTESGIKSLKKELTVGGLIDRASEALLSLFAIIENKVTPDGENYTTYTARNYQNSGPDYLGGTLSGALPNGLLFLTNTEIEMHIGYIKNDGWVIYPTVKEGIGFNLSIGAQATAGWYKGTQKMNAQSLEGYGYYANYSRGILSSGYSVGLDNQNNPVWNFISIGAGKGIPKSLKWSGQVGTSYTGSVHYLRNFSLSN
ncbi:RHS repeat-associated core domain-containing protein [Dysgonomonas sp. OttesenSCG-928-D17]|nr:RHS repeat-associated core domain-containing protein [Dysgonomonas sp. OttesenSCG-928-D17]